MKRFCFSKSKRLLSNEQFRAVMAHRLRIESGLLVLYAAPNQCQYPRLGISVGRTCGNAVVRNKLKRLLREVFRQNQNRIPQSVDYLVMASPRLKKRLAVAKKNGENIWAELTFDEFSDLFLKLALRAAKAK